MKPQTPAKVIWRMRKGMDRRFRQGHPWVYSNELAESPKGIEPGAWVELHDAGGQFLAQGYGNPKSLIAFRALSRNPKVGNPLDTSFILEQLKRAYSLRVQMGMSSVSHRLCFGEADGIPGLVIDRYVIQNGQVFVVQAHTAGANQIALKIEDLLFQFLKEIGQEALWEKTALVLRNDLSVRKLEGVEEEAPRVLKAIAGVSLDQVQIQIQSVQGGAPIHFSVDLVGGQKTGFFLDQFGNIQLAANRLAQVSSKDPKKIRILDLCCYVGQWGAQLAAVYRKQGREVEVVCVDASLKALELAKKNVEAQGARCETVQANVLKELGQFEDQSFDIVVCDPPALIKSRKDIPAGARAYLQLATQVYRIVRHGGGVVTCSCSALLDEQDFIQAQIKGAQRNQVVVQWVGRGGQAPDHPVLLEFPEGRYLKAWVGISWRS